MKTTTKYLLSVVFVLLLVWIFYRATRPVTVYLIYADWCGHCQRLHPDWEVLKDEYSSLNFVDINEQDTAAIESLQNRGVDVSGFPTIVAEKNGKFYPYKGFRLGYHSVPVLRTYLSRMKYF